MVGKLCVSIVIVMALFGTALAKDDFDVKAEIIGHKMEKLKWERLYCKTRVREIEIMLNQWADQLKEIKRIADEYAAEKKRAETEAEMDVQQDQKH